MAVVVEEEEEEEENQMVFGCLVLALLVLGLRKKR